MLVLLARWFNMASNVWFNFKRDSLILFIVILLFGISFYFSQIKPQQVNNVKNNQNAVQRDKLQDVTLQNHERRLTSIETKVDALSTTLSTLVTNVAVTNNSMKNLDETIRRNTSEQRDLERTIRKVLDKLLRKE